MPWELTGNIQALRNQINQRFTRRSKKSDGTIGDLAHQDNKSGHNPDRSGNAEWKDGDSHDEVRALDIDKDLNDDDVSMQDVINHMAKLGRKDSAFPIRYMIYNGKMYHQNNDYVPFTYGGSNPHKEHAHFSGKWSQTADRADDYNYRLDEIGESNVTSPTADQNAAAVAGRDIDPSASTQTWGGAAWTTLIRTGYLANTFAPAIQNEIDTLQARIEDESDDLDAVSATLALMGSVIMQINNEIGVDDNVWYDVMRRAVRDELNAQNAS